MQLNVALKPNSGKYDFRDRCKIRIVHNWLICNESKLITSHLNFDGLHSVILYVRDVVMRRRIMVLTLYFASPPASMCRWFIAVNVVTVLELCKQMDRIGLRLALSHLPNHHLVECNNNITSSSLQNWKPKRRLKMHRHLKKAEHRSLIHVSPLLIVGSN